MTTETAAPATTKPEAPKRAVILMPARMSHAEFVRQDWVATAEEGTTVEDVLNPNFWSNMAAQMKPYDRIEVRVDTGEWLLELLVMNTDRNWASVVLLQQHELVPDAGDVPVPEAFESIWKGPQHRWCVIRKSDKEMLETKLESKQAGIDWIRRYEQTIRRVN